MMNDLSKKNGTPEKRAFPLLKIADGDLIAAELSYVGINCTLLKTVESPTAFTHIYRIASPAQLAKLKKACEVLYFRLKTKVAAIPTDEAEADFALIVEKRESDSPCWCSYKSELQSPSEYLVGVDIENNVVKLSLQKVPHLLIAGASGAGKSVALHTILQSLMVNNKSISKMEWALIDTKQSELTRYADSPLVGTPVATTVIQAVDLLRCSETIMRERYERMKQQGQTMTTEKPIVIVVDELADLMMGGRAVVEPLIVKIAQLGRAANIHLILATQRPTVDVCTGHIKANISARLALMTASARDSMNILDRKGAEELKGRGDGLLKLPNEQIKRLQVFNNKK